MSAGDYPDLMYSENAKTLFFVAWVIAVALAGYALGGRSVPGWVAVVCVAVIPPLVVRRFWRVPEQTMRESIDEARR
jgi:uncharacterized membrane protein YhdT